MLGEQHVAKEELIDRRGKRNGRFAALYFKNEKIKSRPTK